MKRDFNRTDRQTDRQSNQERIGKKNPQNVRKYDAQYKPFYFTYFTRVVLCTGFFFFFINYNSNLRNEESKIESAPEIKSKITVYHLLSGRLIDEQEKKEMKQEDRTVQTQTVEIKRYI